MHALAPGPAVNTAADAQIPHQSVGSAQEFTARVLERTVEQRETRVAREGDARRRRVGWLRLDVQLVVRERAVHQTGIGELELRVGELRVVAVGVLLVARCLAFDVDRLWHLVCEPLTMT